ncbi:hypothetical protein DEU56DRAFT_831229 [Suillus clintonianus]|uniref:uncharacterized protein n=1 Tax=Suillus clintonianus TaxID=1904413 RepID=UPI001B87F61A|nr:uncharacterized protein DEU56DRAFT_831229 [Suillus clintonianus]KAG2122764.1 hypothetical protein DEU56DRAFT_831229 [Suillus clintonianus]
MEFIDLSNLPSSDDEGGAVSHEELKNAVDSMTEARLREIVMRLADKIPALRSALMKEAVVVSGKKRKAVPRWNVCANCEEEYDVSDERDDEECRYHSGNLEVDEDFFADHDERCHGPMDTEENRASFPEGFIWDCCDEDTVSEGCETGQHVPGGKFKKRR